MIYPAVVLLLLAANLVLILLVWRNNKKQPAVQIISSVPYIINQSGIYVLDRNLDCPSAEGSCIDIQADHVTLDLQGYRLSCSSTEPKRTIFGIYERNRQHITVKNGMVAGFFYGVYFEDAARDGLYQPEFGWHRVEQIVASDNTFRGIRVEGLANTVVDNIVIHTGGTEVFEDAFAIGIESVGSAALIKDNRVLETYAYGKGESVGISLLGTGDASQTVSNMVVNTKPSEYDSWGIWASGDTGPFILNNTVYGYEHGIGLASEAHGMFSGNLFYGTEVPAIVEAPVVDGGNNRTISHFEKEFTDFQVKERNQD